MTSKLKIILGKTLTISDTKRLWYSGVNPSNRPSFLPAGLESENFNIKLSVRILNEYDVYSTTDEINVQVSKVYCLILCKPNVSQKTLSKLHQDHFLIWF